MKEKIIDALSCYANDIKDLHWHATSYTHHELLDELYKVVAKATDEIAESLVRLNEIVPNTNGASARIQWPEQVDLNTSTSAIIESLNMTKTELNDPGLTSYIDDKIQDINQLVFYKLRME